MQAKDAGRGGPDAQINDASMAECDVCVANVVLCIVLGAFVIQVVKALVTSADVLLGLSRCIVKRKCCLQYAAIMQINAFIASPPPSPALTCEIFRARGAASSALACSLHAQIQRTTSTLLHT